MWDLIVSVPYHCLSFYFARNKYITFCSFDISVSDLVK